MLYLVLIFLGLLGHCDGMLNRLTTPLLRKASALPTSSAPSQMVRRFATGPAKPPPGIKSPVDAVRKKLATSKLASEGSVRSRIEKNIGDYYKFKADEPKRMAEMGIAGSIANELKAALFFASIFCVGWFTNQYLIPEGYKVQNGYLVPRVHAASNDDSQDAIVVATSSDESAPEAAEFEDVRTGDFVIKGPRASDYRRYLPIVSYDEYQGMIRAFERLSDEDLANPSKWPEEVHRMAYLWPFYYRRLEERRQLYTRTKRTEREQLFISAKTWSFDINNDPDKIPEPIKFHDSFEKHGRRGNRIQKCYNLLQVLQRQMQDNGELRESEEFMRRLDRLDVRMREASEKLREQSLREASYRKC